jgi:hypothetical protein
MRSSVSAVTIACGTLLVLAPFVTSLIAMDITASVMMKSPPGNIQFAGNLDTSEIRWVPFVAGLIMIVLGIVGAFRSKTA